MHLVMTKNPFFKCGYRHLSGNVPANEYAINQVYNNPTEFLIPTYTASGDSSTPKIFKMSSLFTSLHRMERSTKAIDLKSLVTTTSISWLYFPLCKVLTGVKPNAPGLKEIFPHSIIVGCVATSSMLKNDSTDPATT